MSKPWRIVLWIVAGLVIVGVVLLGAWWLWGYATDPLTTELERNAAGQVAQAAIAALALVATALAAIAAFQSKSSAKASEQMVERARLAMSYHNRPSGAESFDSPQARQRYENRPPSELGDAVVNHVQVGDSATATVSIGTSTGARMSAIKLTYVTTDGHSHDVLLREGQPSGELEGVRVVNFVHPHPSEHLPPLAYSIRQVTVECFDAETTTTWRATNSDISNSVFYGVHIPFERVG